MKLSDAIREGGRGIRQSFDGFIEYKENGDVVQACAMGMALIVCGYDWPEHLHQAIERRWPWVFTRRDDLRCTQCKSLHPRVYDAVIHLNDEHLWPPERIAQWVQQFETAETTPTVEQVATEELVVA
jgi:hypothetical protein